MTVSLSQCLISSVRPYDQVPKWGSSCGMTQEKKHKSHCAEKAFVNNLVSKTELFLDHEGLC